MSIKINPSNGIFFCSMKVVQLTTSGFGGINNPGSVIFNRVKSQIKTNKKERT
jgi:hypothetical protein